MSAMAAEIWLPAPVRRRIETAAAGLLGEGAPAADFLRPAGEAALVAADSVSWRIFKNPVALFIGGIAAVILELAEPKVRAGVWDHTSFRTDPVRRMRRTGMAAMVTVYAARSVAEAMIAGVVRMHGRVTGVTAAGEPYRADDVELLDWVQATAGFGFVGAYDRYVRRLDGAAIDAAYAEAAPAARLYGALGAPVSRAQMAALFARTAPRLEASPVVFEFLDIVRAAPIMPAALRPAQRMLIRAAVELVPGDLRARLGLGEAFGLRAWERPLVRAAGVAAERLRLDSLPPVQACRRLGLPDDYLYRTPAGA